MFDNEFPNTLDPLLYITLLVTVCTTNVCAVKVFATVKFPAKEAVAAYEALNTDIDDVCEFCTNELVWLFCTNELVWLVNTTFEPFNERDPVTITEPVAFILPFPVVDKEISLSLVKLLINKLLPVVYK